MLDGIQDLDPGVLEDLPIFPLPNVVLMPGMVLPLNVFEPRYLALVDHALDHGMHLGVPLLCPGFEDQYEGSPAVEPVFGVGRLTDHRRLPDGRRLIRVVGVGRAAIVEEHATDAPFRRVRGRALTEDHPRQDAALELIRAQVERLLRCADDDYEDRVLRTVLSTPDSRLMLYAMASLLPTLGVVDRAVRGRFEAHRERCPLLEFQQRCLAAETAEERLALIHEGAACICSDLEESGRFQRESAMLH